MNFKSNKKIKHIVVHCSATFDTMNIGAKEINEWHLERGWSGIGYHFVIRRDGTIEAGRDINKDGSHVRGHNKDTLSICIVGGLSKDRKNVNNFTVEQFFSLKVLLMKLSKYNNCNSILGHRDFPGVSKECPCFDVRLWLQGLDDEGLEGIGEDNV